MMTSVPCPSWCDLPAGHPYHAGAGELFRNHRRELGATDRRLDGPRVTGYVAVLLEMLEDAVTNDGPAGELCPLQISVTGLDEELTGLQARQLAAALIAAADMWDRLTS